MNRAWSKSGLQRHLLASLLVAGVLLLAARGVQQRRPVEAQAPNTIVQSLTAEEQAWLRDHPVIRVAQAPDWPPVEFTDERGEPSGMSEDYLSLIGQRLGVTFERVRGLSWQEAYARLKRWEIDMTTSVTVTPERVEFWAFTKPYMDIPNVIFADVNVTYIADMRELTGMKVAVADNYAVSEWIPRDFPDIHLIKVKNVQEGLETLQRREVSAYIGDMLVSGYCLTKLKMTTLKIAGNTPYVNAQSMAVRKDWATLAGILDKALDSISETERNDIYRKWLPIRYEHGFDYTLLWQALAVFTVILLGFAAWVWRLTREIAARKNTEKALQESESRLRQITDNITDVVFSTDLNLNMLYVSPSVKNLLGVSVDEYLTKRADERHPSGTLQTFRMVLAEELEKEKAPSLDKNRSRIIEGEHFTPDGRTTWVAMHVSFIRDENGQPIGIQGVTRDITARKKIEEEQQRYINELKTIYETARRLQHLYAPENLAQELIDIMEQTLSYEYGAVLLFDESIGGLIPFAFNSQGHDPNCVNADNASLLSHQTTIGAGVTGWVAQTGQSVRLGDVRSDPRYDARRANMRSELCVPLQAGDRIIGVLNIETTRSDAYNESDQRLLETVAAQMALAIQQARLYEQIRRHSSELEQRVAERTAQLESANQELDAFAYSVSHDLRAPLRGIAGLTTFLVEDYGPVLDAQGQKYCALIRESTQHMNRLIDALLAFSRAGRAGLRRQKIDMRALAQEIFEALTPPDQRQSIAFCVGDLAEASGDLSLIRQVWTNLLSNALKFTSKRARPEIAVTCTRDDQRIVYRVQDNGAGFDMEYRPKLFSVFQRLHSSQEFEGTGVGLAIVQRIIQRHGGEVWAEGALDQGATFYFSLPV